MIITLLIKCYVIVSEMLDFRKFQGNFDQRFNIDIFISISS